MVQAAPDAAAAAAPPRPPVLGPDNPEVVIRRRAAPAADTAVADGGAAVPPPPRARRFLALLAVHGDEPCGVAAANCLLASGVFDAAAADPACPFDELRLVVGNPRALAAGTRFLDLNLNRCFTADIIAKGAATGEQYEAARAAQLAPLIDSAGALLDLHSTSVETPPFAFYVPGDSGSGQAPAAPTELAADGGPAAEVAAPKPAAEPHEAALALSMPVAYVVRDYTGAGMGLAIERAAASASAAGESVRATCVECGQHAAPSSIHAAEACLRAFIGAPPAAAAAPPPPKHVVSRTGVVVRPGFRWAWRGGAGPPPAFAPVAHREVVATDGEAGAIACPCPGGALVFMPAGAPRVGEDAMLWAEDFGP